MYKYTLPLYLLLFLSQQALSQRAQLNPSLYRAIDISETPGEIISLLAQGDVITIEKSVKQLGGIFKYSVDDIASFSLPLNRILALAEIPGINRIEGFYGDGQLMDDMTNINANVNPVHLGNSPLSQAYNGSGVVMAFLDSGIDFNHPDFQHADGTTRIRWLWDQNMTTGGTTPDEFGYGQEWDSTSINNGECTHFESPGYFGHGSNVSGIGAGNGLAVNNFEGVAPKSDIITVAIKFDYNFLNNVVDATKYAFDKAAEIGKPCVINASIGTYGGSHDGTDLPALLIDDLITQQNGRTFVCAGGNAGNINFHLGYEAEQDSSFTWFYYHNGLQSVFYEWWIDKADATNFNFSIGADLTTPFTYLGRTKYYNLVNDFNYVNNVATKKDTLFQDATRLGIITITSYRFDSTYACDVTIKPDLTTYYWRFITQGSGRFDAWSGASTTGTSDMLGSIYLPDTTSFPDITRYHLPDNSETIVSSFTCSDKVITVANYTNRNEYIDYYGHAQVNSDVTGALAVSSSFGPTRDNRIKPEVAAPGNTTLATGQLYTLAGFLLYQPYKLALGGMHNRNGGTSMASPVVAGVAAMYLQKNPEASWKEVKAAITTTAKSDSLTGFNLPDNEWGYGKVDAFAAMTTPIILGCTDPASLNFNPDATVNDQSCIPIVFGCTDVTADNYDPSANVNDGSCQYFLGVTNQEDDHFLNCYPNPSNGTTQFFFSKSENDGDRKLVITNITGQIVESIMLPSNGSSITHHFNLDKGIYFCELQQDEIGSPKLKLIIQ